MDDQPTCGKGLAQHSVLPAKMGELIDALAENLEVHQPTLVLTDDNARTEYAAYVTLAQAYRSIASKLQSTAQQMAGYRDLPMALHDERALSEPRLREAFASFVKLEQELLTLLQDAVQRDESMLQQMTP